MAMKIFRRGIAWTFYLGMLSAVGVVTFWFVRYQPRCTISGPLRVWRLAADGSRVVTERSAEEAANHGEVQVWSTVNEGVVHQVFSQGRIGKLSHSPNGRFLVARLEGGRVSVVDCDRGTEMSFNGLPPIASFQFSAKGRWLVAAV